MVSTFRLGPKKTDNGAETADMPMETDTVVQSHARPELRRLLKTVYLKVIPQEVPSAETAVMVVKMMPILKQVMVV